MGWSGLTLLSAQQTAYLRLRALQSIVDSWVSNLFQFSTSKTRFYALALNLLKCIVFIAHSARNSFSSPARRKFRSNPAYPSHVCLMISKLRINLIFFKIKSRVHFCSRFPKKLDMDHSDQSNNIYWFELSCGICANTGISSERCILYVRAKHLSLS